MVKKKNYFVFQSFPLSYLFYFYLFFFNQSAFAIPSQSLFSNFVPSFSRKQSSVFFYRGNLNKLAFKPTLKLPRRIRERVVGGLFLRFLEAFFGSKVFFFFIRNAWALLGSLVFLQEHLFARRISQYSNWGARHRRGQWWWGSRILALAVGSKDPELLISWLQTRLKLMSLYAHRRFFRLLGLLLRGIASSEGTLLLRGFYMRLVGKISVVGNAMSRVW